ncbi:imidazoleglycerol-phosphate dehydratase HisB [Gracilimonas sp. BCB1]|uniref:imidazoleglycerol-phosphate dehydratase HisB n=1 Tax=Gracilimonas sp. BCB1 TaxID=3152362 RepID=UPI0032D8E3C6
MLVAITKDVLTDPEKKFRFRKNSIISLKRIFEAGHNLLIEQGDISEDQDLILAQEQIPYETKGEADLIITGSGQQLQLLKKEKELLSAEGWVSVVEFITQKARKASIERKTNETDISININLDGTGKADISTGLNFFDHMLDQIARHGLIDLKLTCKGDLEVDEHHTIEDVAIALGEVITKALGNKKGIERYGFVLPMDEAQATVALDLSGRPFLVFEGEFKREYVGDMPTEMIKHFFYSLAMNLKATIHVSFSGDNDHHKIEACFKGLARALKMAIEQNGRIKNLIPSSKGTL